jgi:hypothetical protein
VCGVQEEKVGSPEKPLSDLGQVSYRSYWASTLIDLMRTMSPAVEGISVMDLSKRTSILAEDVVSTLMWVGLLRYMSGQYTIFAPPEELEELSKKFPVKAPVVETSQLHWAPLITAETRRDKWNIKSKLPPGDPRSLMDT